jgi:hypothetical protein
VYRGERHRRDLPRLKQVVHIRHPACGRKDAIMKNVGAGVWARSDDGNVAAIPNTEPTRSKNARVSGTANGQSSDSLLKSHSRNKKHGQVSQVPVFGPPCITERNIMAGDQPYV